MGTRVIEAMSVVESYNPTNKHQAVIVLCNQLTCKLNNFLIRISKIQRVYTEKKIEIQLEVKTDYLTRTMFLDLKTAQQGETDFQTVRGNEL